MHLLHWVLANPDFRAIKAFPEAWGEPPSVPAYVGDAVFSVLYSDVGGRFYEECGPQAAAGGGWAVRSPVSTLWNVPPEEGVSTDNEGQPAKWRWLGAEDLEKTWKEDTRLIKADLNTMLLRGDAHAVCTFTPLGGVGAIQFRQTADLTEPGYPLPSDIWGVRLVDGHDDVPAYASWTVELRGPGPKSLVFTRLRVSPGQFREVWGYVLVMARRLGVETIDIWNLNEDLVDVAHAIGGRTVTREEHLPAIAWYGPERAESVSWAFNERYVVGDTAESYSPTSATIDFAGVDLNSNVASLPEFRKWALKKSAANAGPKEMCLTRRFYTVSQHVLDPHAAGTIYCSQEREWEVSGIPSQGDQCRSVCERSGRSGGADIMSISYVGSRYNGCMNGSTARSLPEYELLAIAIAKPR